MDMNADSSFDLVVVGAGIVGLAHAWAGASRGLRVCVVERDAMCIGASIRNFGFITVTGQPAGDTWRRARRSQAEGARRATSGLLAALREPGQAPGARRLAPDRDRGPVPRRPNPAERLNRGFRRPSASARARPAG